MCHNGRTVFIPWFAGWPFQRTEPACLAGKRPSSHGQVLTCADIDHDGDLDVFLGQYSDAGGRIASPYYNANNGNPAYLLKNDGHGNFTDQTEVCGLSAKRNRLSYSASFVRSRVSKGFDFLSSVILEEWISIKITERGYL